eukprot:7068192-Ditylum_brightwellii.AAC.1
MRSPAPCHHLEELNELDSYLVETNKPHLSSQEEEQWALREAYANLPTPKVSGTAMPPHMIPITLMLVRSILHTLIHARALLPNVCARSSKGREELQTLMGVFMVQREVMLTDIFLPEFDKTKSVDSIKAIVFNSPCNYNMIVGQDFLESAGITLNFKLSYMEWLEKRVTMKATVNGMHLRKVDDHRFLFDDEGVDSTSYTSEIKDVKYDAVLAREVADQQQHLLLMQCQLLQQVLEGIPEVFDRKLGLYPHQNVHLEVQEGAKPYHTKAYSAPRVYLEVFKKELMHLVEIGVLRPCGPTEWATGTIIVPKKDGRV